MQHRFDVVTCFCLDCGASMEAANEGRGCSPKNVVAVSHLISHKRMKRLLGPLAA